MAVIDFKPRKILLVFWLIWAFAGILPLAGLSAMFSAAVEVSPWAGFSVGGFVILALFDLYLILYFNSIRYHLDDRYISRSSGVLWKKRRSIPLGKVTNIDVRQGPVERLLGFGQIWIFTPSTGASIPEEKLIGVSNPHDMKGIIVARSEQSKPGNVPKAAAGPAGTAPDGNTGLLMEIRDSLVRIEKILRDSDKPA